VKLLLDENLSRRLVPEISPSFPGSAHVCTCGLETADDGTVWTYAADHGFTIVTKDTDFHQRCFLYGAPPKVVWIRLGNCPTDDVARLLVDRAAEILAFGDEADAALLVLP